MRKGTGQRVFAIVGDGEMNEGSIWEALLFARHFQLSNLLVIVDANGFQAMGATDEVMQLGSLAAKLQAFGLATWEVDGHDEPALDATIRAALADIAPQPRAIVARTLKGKGVSFMEGDNRWHYTRLSSDSYTRALSELQNGTSE
jgi:transketolase